MATSHETAMRTASLKKSVGSGSGWPGRKGASGVVQKIISAMPPHLYYFEPFVGRSPVFQLKRPASLDMGMDLDHSIVKWWKKNAPCRIVVKGDGLRPLTHSAAMRDPDLLVYIDPPYLRSVRTRWLYQHEMTEGQHVEMLEGLLRAKCKVMLSGYWSSLYASILEGWRHIKFRSMTRGGVREEFVWLNFPRPPVLHDCRFIGRDFREREKLKRRRESWTSRFRAMPAAERQLIWEALELASPDSAVVGTSDASAIRAMLQEG